MTGEWNWHFPLHICFSRLIQFVMSVITVLHLNHPVLLLGSAEIRIAVCVHKNNIF